MLPNDNLIKWKVSIFFEFEDLIKLNIALQTCCYERTGVGGQNALNALQMNARGSGCQENYWATMKHRELFLSDSSVFSAFSLHFSDVQSCPTKMRNMTALYYSLKTEIQKSVIQHVCRRDAPSLLQEMGWFTEILLFLSFALLCVFFFDFSHSCLSFLFPSFYSWQHDLPLCVTVTWASASPHITAAFDWPGLSRSVSCCLIITLFDCWSRDVIDWSALPVWGYASEVALCVWVCIEVGGWLIAERSSR